MGANCCRPTRYFQTKRAGGDSGYTRQIWSENADEAFNDFDGVDSEEELRTYGRLWCMPACCLWSYAGVTCFKNMTNCTNDRRFLYMRYPFCCCHSKEGLEDKHFLKDPNNAKSERATNHQNYWMPRRPKTYWASRRCLTYTVLFFIVWVIGIVLLFRGACWLKDLANKGVIEPETWIVNENPVTDPFALSVKRSLMFLPRGDGDGGGDGGGGSGGGGGGGGRGEELLEGSAPRVGKRFEGSEHRSTANYDSNITIIDPDNLANPFKVVNITSFNFVGSEGTNLHTYGDLIALAGDFFGVLGPTSVICSAAYAQDEQMAIFTYAFNDMWQTTKASYVDLAKAELDKEDRIGNPPNQDRAWKSFATLDQTRWLPFGLYRFVLTLAINNIDHFTTCANSSYQIAHYTAMSLAEKAGAPLKNRTAFDLLPAALRKEILTNASKDLTMAYAMNAYGDHYLTDLFSAGHIRTPRKLLLEECGTEILDGYDAFTSLVESGNAAQWMHDEDNRNGLVVTNRRGDTWFTLGDDNFFDTRNRRSQELVREAVTRSRQEVLDAFMGLGFNYSALEIIPDPILTEEKHSAYNTCPLYKVDSIYGVKKRNPMGNLRPPAWRYKHGLAIDADPTCCSIAEKSPSINRTVCCYCPMERPDCPTSGITKVAEIFDVNYNQGQVLEPVQDQMAWASVFPDYFDDSLSAAYFPARCSPVLGKIPPYAVITVAVVVAVVGAVATFFTIDFCLVACRCCRMCCCCCTLCRSFINDSTYERRCDRCAGCYCWECARFEDLEEISLETLDYDDHFDEPCSDCHQCWCGDSAESAKKGCNKYCAKNCCGYWSAQWDKVENNKKRIGVEQSKSKPASSGTRGEQELSETAVVSVSSDDRE